jgi:hypothetical protein
MVLVINIPKGLLKWFFLIFILLFELHLCYVRKKNHYRSYVIFCYMLSCHQEFYIMLQTMNLKDLIILEISIDWLCRYWKWWNDLNLTNNTKNADIITRKLIIMKVYKFVDSVVCNYKNFELSQVRKKS